MYGGFWVSYSRYCNIGHIEVLRVESRNKPNTAKLLRVWLNWQTIKSIILIRFNVSIAFVFRNMYLYCLIPYLQFVEPGL